MFRVQHLFEDDDADDVVLVTFDRSVAFVNVFSMSKRNEVRNPCNDLNSELLILDKGFELVRSSMDGPSARPT